mmetsp:Transcript_9157/g.20844  ORF Transcript_9157/g.20844 Transcript_9157/m.20844 type:complete len:213 (+) Transcript_9157:485-1123(+)
MPSRYPASMPLYCSCTAMTRALNKIIIAKKNSKSLPLTISRPRAQKPFSAGAACVALDLPCMSRSSPSSARLARSSIVDISTAAWTSSVEKVRLSLSLPERTVSSSIRDGNALMGMSPESSCCFWLMTQFLLGPGACVRPELDMGSIVTADAFISPGRLSDRSRTPDCPLGMLSLAFSSPRGTKELEAAALLVPSISSRRVLKSSRSCPCSS